MDDKIKQALSAMAGQPPHKADYSRRQFIANAARYGLTMTAAAALTQPFAFPVAALAADVELPKIDSIPDKLKGSGAVRICSYGGALQDAQRKAYFNPSRNCRASRSSRRKAPIRPRSRRWSTARTSNTT